MAGKSGKGKGKGKGKSESAAVASTVVQPLTSATGLPELVLKKAPAVPAAVEQLAVEAAVDDVAEALAESPKVDSEKTDGADVSGETTVDEKKANSEEVEARDGSGNGDADGEAELLLYPITVKGPSGEKLELQVNPGDSVMDLRQFLLDAPETCFYTCYDLILNSAEGVRYHLAEYLEIGEVADISAGGCSLEMINAMYDDRMVRSHVRRTRDLISSALIHSSLSTALAVEYETNQAGGEEKNKKDKATSKDKPAGSVKTELAELEGGLGFMEDSCGQLGSLVTPSESQEKAVETIAFSSFNPVPGYRRLLGDLIYLDVVTAEGKSFCVTAHTRGFYVNASKGNTLKAEPVTPAVESTTLVGLLRLLSKKFVSGFAEILNKKAAGHPFENVPVLLPPNAWLGPYPTPPHKRDIARAEDALMVPYGTEVVGMQRDWNEELQSCREFSRDNLQDRIMRDRALYKVNCDFVDAATKGAKAVINRCIPPINPTDPDRFHMYVHNNIFFSFAVDGDFSLMQQMREQLDESATKTDGTATEKPSAANGEVKLDNADSTESDAPSNGDANSAAAVVESEQATYASANNDLKGTKAYNNADVSGLYTLAMAIVDYRGHRVVAQSIIPGILQGDKTESLLYGSVDNGKKIAWNEKFHSKALEAGKLLHIKEHAVLDGAGKTVTICAPVECKGIVGSDDRHYLLDLMRTTPRDINYTGPGSRLCVLRPELVATFCQVEAQERVGKNKTEEETDEKALVQEELSKIVLNPNVFTDFKLAGTPEEIEADEELVRKAGNYLKDTVLPRFVADLSSLEVSPMDGPTLTDALHAHGINIRYLGQVAKKAEHLPHIWDLTVVEMVVRAAKHVLKGVLRETLDQNVGGAIAHFFNCLVGPESAKPDVEEGSTEPSGKSETKTTSGKSLSTEASEAKPSYLCITPDLVWSDIEESVKFKYQFDLPSDVRSRVRKISTFRNLSQKMGVMLAARKFDFQADAPFKTSDILDLQSVVKHLSPVCVDARDLLENGKLSLAQGKLNEAYEAFSEAFTILQQVCGPMHREVANCCRYLAMVLYHAGDMPGAIMQQHKELIINERCLGSDHPDTAHSYGNMALFYHGLNQTELALRHMARTILLLNVSCGSDHPDVAATFINIAMMYQDIGKMNVALRYLQEALKRNERLLGEEHIQTAVCYHALAIAFNCMGAYKLSLQHERSTYNILLKQLGEEDSRTKDSANWIKTFQIRDIQANAQKQRGQQAVSAAAAQKAAADALKARPDLVQAFQQAAASSSVNRGPTGTSPQMKGPRGAPDERAARAVNEVRKKAAARGLQVRPQAAAPNQSVPPLGDLLSLINSGVAGKAPLASSTPSSSTPRGSSKAAQTAGKKTATATASPKSAAPVSAVANGPVQATAAAADPSPIGLGNGLGGLESSKKKKSKSKNAA
ncbi:hypothetical protein KC19_5G050100 [Ceratodon purpureus]|uniref:Clu domain-containing protein n=1 Tax=Ceratodon purpureus TaxID=3225 RepID=A0A8T0HZ30_CERPU|nr:hypothetical protein KC19_5G050100 [Ceratodon purpureus]